MGRRGSLFGHEVAPDYHLSEYSLASEISFVHTLRRVQELRTRVLQPCDRDAARLDAPIMPRKFHLVPHECCGTPLGDGWRYACRVEAGLEVTAGRLYLFEEGNEHH